MDSQRKGLKTTTKLNHVFYMYTDVNECNSDNGGCAQTCENTMGSFVCSCGAGFQLASDNLDCEGKSSFYALNNVFQLKTGKHIATC